MQLDLFEQEMHVFAVCERLAERRHALRRDAPHDDVAVIRTVLAFDLPQPRLDARQPPLFRLQLLCKLRPLELEHAADFVDWQVVIQQRRDLLQREAQVAEREDAVEARQLIGRVVAVAGLRVDARRPEQAQPIVVPEHLDRNAAELREIANLEHGRGTLSTRLTQNTLSHGGRVKRLTCQRGQVAPCTFAQNRPSFTSLPDCLQQKAARIERYERPVV